MISFWTGIILSLTSFGIQKVRMTLKNMFSNFEPARLSVTRWEYGYLAKNHNYASYSFGLAKDSILVAFELFSTNSLSYRCLIHKFVLPQLFHGRSQSLPWIENILRQSKPSLNCKAKCQNRESRFYKLYGSSLCIVAKRDPSFSKSLALSLQLVYILVFTHCYRDGNVLPVGARSQRSQFLSSDGWTLCIFWIFSILCTY